MPPHVPLNEVGVAIQSAIERILAKHNDVPIDKLWIGFVAPENVATQANAAKIASEIGHEAGVTAHASVGTLAAPAPVAGGVQTEAMKLPGHIIGLVFQPRAEK